MNPPSKVNLQFRLGETWAIGPIACTDASGNALASCPVSLRIFSTTAVVLDAAVVTDGSGNANYSIPGSAQAENEIAAAFNFYEVRAFPNAGGAYDQQYGTFNIQQSAFVLFPFTDQYPDGPPGPALGLFLNYTLINASNVSQLSPLVAGARYAVDTTTALSLALPALSGLASGSTIEIADITGLANTNPITVEPNGSDLINGVNTAFTEAGATNAVKFVVADINGTASWQTIT